MGPGGSPAGCGVGGTGQPGDGPDGRCFSPRAVAHSGLTAAAAVTFPAVPAPAPAPERALGQRKTCTPAPRPLPLWADSPVPGLSPHGRREPPPSLASVPEHDVLGGRPCCSLCQTSRPSQPRTPGRTRHTACPLPSHDGHAVSPFWRRRTFASELGADVPSLPVGRPGRGCSGVEGSRGCFPQSAPPFTSPRPRSSARPLLALARACRLTGAGGQKHPEGCGPWRVGLGGWGPGAGGWGGEEGFRCPGVGAWPSPSPRGPTTRGRSPGPAWRGPGDTAGREERGGLCPPWLHPPHGAPRACAGWVLTWAGRASPWA